MKKAIDEERKRRQEFFPPLPRAVAFCSVFLAASVADLGRTQTFSLTIPPEEAQSALSLEVPESPLSSHSTRLVRSLEELERELRALEARQDLTLEERAKERDRLQRDYQTARQLFEMEKERQARAEEARRQGNEFTRLYLQLDMAAEDFPQKFRELEKRFPLAIEDPFSRKLIERARRFIERLQGQDANPPASPSPP